MNTYKILSVTVLTLIVTACATEQKHPQMDEHAHHSHAMNSSHAVAKPAATQAPDQRLIVEFTADQRKHFLTDMRTLLGGTQGIIKGLADNDMQAVAKAARSVGMDMKHDPDGDFHSAIPKSMMKIGMGMHKQFDKVAKDAETLKNPEHTLAQLNQTMQHCMACHETYQIKVTE